MDNGQIDFTNLSAKKSLRILLEHPDQADKCDWKEMRRQLDGLDWVWLLSAHPQFADRCLWVSLDGYCWARLLSAHPQFADRCLWASLEGDDWAHLLYAQPQFSYKCDKWDEIPAKGPYRTCWLGLLERQPWFADKCDKWGEFDERDWHELLKILPQFTDKRGK